MKNIGGSIPCEGCGKNIHMGIVYKIGDESFICEDCHENAEKMFTRDHNNLEQFEEK